MFYFYLLAISLLAQSNALYQDTSYPYDVGPLTVDTRIYNPTLNPLNPPPMHTKVYFPTEADQYAIMYYITGFAGVNPASIYDDTLLNISSHGYVIIAPWPVAGDDGPSFTAEDHLENLDWFEEQLPEDLNDVVASFADVSVGCHSAGCSPTLNMALNRTEQIKSLVNLEPVARAILSDQPDHYLPSFNYGAELANDSCAYTGRDFETWHRLLDCPKIMLELADVGHCDFLDYEIWTVCKDFNVCVVGEEDQLAEYRLVISGLASAFMTGYVQGNEDQLKYLTDPNLIPWLILQHDVDINC